MRTEQYLRKTHAKTLSALATCLLAVPVSSPQVPLLDHRGMHVGSSIKVEMQGESFFALGEGTNEIHHRSLQGVLKTSYPTGSVEGFDVLHTLDFALDPNERLHALLATRSHPGERPSIAIRKFEDPDVFTHVTLDRPMQAWHLCVDGQANYYLLGVEDGVYFQSQQATQPGTTQLIHKFSQDGSWSFSSFPAPAPRTREDFKRLLASVMTARMVVLPGGEVYLLWDTADRRAANLLQSPLQLYRIQPGGAVENLQLRPPADTARIVGIHRYGSDLAIEWANFGTVDLSQAPKGVQVGLPVESAELSLLRGTSQSILQRAIQGKVLAVGSGSCIISVYKRPEGLRLFLQTLSPGR